MKIWDLFQFKEENFYNSNRVLKRVLNRRKRLFWLSGGLVCVAMILVVSLLFFLRSSQEPQGEILVEGAMNIIESIESSDGALFDLPQEAKLKIKTTEDVSAGELKARLYLSHSVSFKLKRSGPCNYQLSFVDALEEGKLYNLKAVYNGIEVDSWALQTRIPFSVVASSPSEGGNDILSAVEISFSHADVEGFEEAFSIEPKVDGRFEHYGNTWGFIPSAPLEEGTLYHVTLKKSVLGPNDESLSEDYSFSFQTDYGRSYAYLINGESGPADHFLVNEAPVAALSWSMLDISKAKVKVYPLKGADHFIEVYQKYVRCGMVSEQIMSEGGEPLSQFETKPVPAENYGPYESAAFIQYPDAFPKGYYFSSIDIGGKVLYQLFQITDLSVFSFSVNEDYVVWVNDAVSGGSVSGEKIDLEGFQPTKTSSSGIAILKGAKEKKELRCLKVGDDNAPFIAMLKNESKEEALKENYYSYISSNSPIYRIGEKVQLFGAVLPRTMKGAILSSVTLKSEFFEEDLILSTDPNGAYTAEFIMPDGVKDPVVSVWVKDTLIDSINLCIMQEAPKYYLSVSTDKNAYVIGEKVTFFGSITDSNGAPAANISITDGDDLHVVSDENGTFSGSFSMPYDENAVFEQLRVSTLQLHPEEDYTVFGSCNYLVLAAEYILESDFKENVLSIGAFAANLDSAKAWDSDSIGAGKYDEKDLKGDSAEIDIYAELHEVRYEKIEAGETYNPISRQLQTKWSSIERDSIAEKYNLKTVNGIASVQIPKSDSSKRYYVNLFLGEERKIPAGKVYLNDDRDDNQYSIGNTYELVASQNVCSLGEDVSFGVRREEDHSVINNGSLIYMVVGNELLDVSYSSSSRVILKFKEEYAPDAWVYAAYFDGKHCHYLGRDYLSYQKDDFKLQIEMELSSDSAVPGEEITMKFKVKNSRGNPVSATLNVGLMDRKLYCINEFLEPVDEIYTAQSISTDSSFYSSYRDFNQMEDYGMGAFDPEISRASGCNYTEGTFCKNIVTDQNGEGSLSLILPTNSAEWKLIAKAITQNGEAGSNVFALSPQKNLNTHVVMQKSFDIEEKCKLSIMAEGNGLTGEDICQFQIGVNDSKGQEIAKLSRQGLSGHYIHLDLGILPSGYYMVYIQNKAGHYEDNVILPFNVCDQSEPVLMQESAEKQEEFSFMLKPLGSSSIITVADQSMALWPQAMIHLQNAKGAQIDRFLAKKLVESFYNCGSWKEAAAIIPSEYGYDGLKSLPTDESGDLRVSAIIAAIAPNSVDRAMMVDYFENYLNNRYASSSDRILAYLGLGALGEPILDDLQYQYKQAVELSSEEAIYMALAFAYSGDHQTARFIYDQKVKALIEGEEELCIQKDGQADQNMSSLAAVLAAKIGATECSGLLNFALNHSSDNCYLNYALIAYLKHYVGADYEEIQVTVSMNGNVETHRFHRCAPLILIKEGEGEVRIISKNSDLSVLCGYFSSGIRS